MIELGIKLLDESVPDWRVKIDVTKLDMIDKNWCVLGQVYGTFDLGLRTLNLSAVELGFDAKSFISQQDANEKVKKLTIKWKEALIC